MLKNKLFVLIDESLEPIYGCVQGGHAVAQWLIEHPIRKWNNDYLIYLSADIKKWKCRLELMGIEYTEFKEPDLNGMTTAIAVYAHDTLFRKLKCVSI